MVSPSPITVRALSVSCNLEPWILGFEQAKMQRNSSRSLSLKKLSGDKFFTKSFQFFRKFADVCYFTYDAFSAEVGFRLLICTMALSFMPLNVQIWARDKKTLTNVSCKHAILLVSPSKLSLLWNIVRFEDSAWRAAEATWALVWRTAKLTSKGKHFHFLCFFSSALPFIYALLFLYTHTFICTFTFTCTFCTLTFPFTFAHSIAFSNGADHVLCLTTRDLVLIFSFWLRDPQENYSADP